MGQRFGGKARSYLSAIATMVMLSLVASVLPARADTVGKITQVKGKAQVVRGGSTIDATADMPVELHDQLKTGSPGEITLQMADNSVLTLNEYSVLSIDEGLVSGGTRTTTNVGLLTGSVHSLVSAVARTASPNFTVTTPNAIAGVRGTDFTCRYSTGTARAGFPNCLQFTDCATASGVVMVSNNPPRPGASVQVGPGQKSTVACAAAPLLATTGTVGLLGTTLSTGAIVGAGLATGAVISGTTVGVLLGTGGGGGGGGAITVSPSR